MSNSQVLMNYIYNLVNASTETDSPENKLTNDAPSEFIRWTIGQNGRESLPAHFSLIYSFLDVLNLTSNSHSPQGND